VPKNKEYKIIVIPQDGFSYNPICKDNYLAEYGIWAVVTFYSCHGRMPTSVLELQCFCKEYNFVFDVSKYDDIILSENEIEYQYKYWNAELKAVSIKRDIISITSCNMGF
jgi:hypothetical protein